MRKPPETSKSLSRNDPAWRKIMAENSDVDDDVQFEDDADHAPPVKNTDSSSDEQIRRANNALRYHTSMGDAEKVQQALNDGASLGPLDNQENTAAYYCVKNGHPECLKILLAAGFDIDTYGLTLVTTAIQELMSISAEDIDLEAGIQDCLSILKTCGATTDKDIKRIGQEIIDEQLQQKTNAFSLAIDAINDDAQDDLFALIESGVDVNDVDVRGKLLAEYAIDLAHIDCLDCIISHGLNIALHGAKLMLQACQLVEQHPEDSDLSINYRACVELLQAAGAPSETIHPASQKERSRSLPDFDQERQKNEHQRSRAGQESETELICPFAPGVFFTAGGYKRPRFFVIDPIIRSWNVNKIECSGQFDGSMEIKDASSEVKIAPRGLCKAGDDLLAVNYGTHVQLIKAATKEVVEKIDLSQSFSRSSSRLSFTPKSPRKGSIRLPSPRREVPSQPIAIAITTSPAERLPPPKHSPRAPVIETKRRTTLSASSKSQVPVIKTADMCTLPKENHLLVTSIENEIKMWNIHSVICTAVYSDKKAGSLQKLLALSDQCIFGLDDKNNVFLWDVREKGATKASVFIAGTGDKCDPCVATFGDVNLIAIGYRGENGRGQDYPRVLDLRVKSLVDIDDESTKFTLQGATFCSMGNGTLAVASKKLVHHNYPICGKDNLVQGKLISIYTPANHKLKFVDIFTQEKEDPSRYLPMVVTMQKVDENKVALGLSSEKGMNTLKISHTNTHEYQWENAMEDSVVLQPQFK